MLRTRSSRICKIDLRRAKFVPSHDRARANTKILLQLDYLAVGIGEISVWKLPAVHGALDQIAACLFDLPDHAIVILDVQLEPKVLESARHADGLIRSNLVQCQ
jgi:hypothetical protein